MNALPPCVALAAVLNWALPQVPRDPAKPDEEASQEYPVHPIPDARPTYESHALETIGVVRRNSNTTHEALRDPADFDITDLQSLRSEGQHTIR
jgi:hypothetical protein